MASPKYKLIYFDIRGKAEPIRWMFAYAGISFEDFRIKELPYYVSSDPKPEWDALKTKLPFGTVPVLEVDGKYLGETYAIARYLAKPLGLSGANDWEAGQADSIATFISSDFEAPFMQVMREMDPEKKNLAKENLVEIAPKIAAILEKFLAENHKTNGSGFFVGKSPTTADFFAAASFYEFTEGFLKPGLLSQFKLLTTHRDLVRGLPGVKESIQKYSHLPF